MRPPSSLVVPHATGECLLAIASLHDAGDDQVDAIEQEIAGMPACSEEKDCETCAIERHRQSPSIA